MGSSVATLVEPSVLHREMRNVKTFAKAEGAAGAAGAAVETGVKTLGKRAQRARKMTRRQAKRARKQLAAQVPDRPAVKRARRGARSTALVDRFGPVQGDFGDRLDSAQGLLAERVLDARRDLASRIDPAPARRRWPWLLLLIAVGGVATSAALARRPQPVDEVGSAPGRSARHRAGELGSPDGNGMVVAEHPSARGD